MNGWKKIKSFFEEISQYWYVMISIWILLEICNYELLGMLIPGWGCTCISIFLVVLAAIYVSFMYRYVKQQIKNYMNSKGNILSGKIEDLEQCICKLYEENREFANQLAESLYDKMKYDSEKKTEKIISKVTADANIRNSEVNDNLNILLQKEQENTGDIIKHIEETHGTVEHAHQQTIEQITGQVMALSEMTENQFNRLNENAEEGNTSIFQAIKDYEQKNKELYDSRADEISNIRRDMLVKFSDIEDRVEKYFEESNHKTELDVRQTAEEIISRVTADANIRNSEVNGNLHMLLQKEQENTGEIIKYIEETHDTVKHVHQQAARQISNIEKNNQQLQEIYRKIEVDARTMDTIHVSIEGLEAKTVRLQDELTKLLVQILDEADDYAEKMDNANNRMFEQAFSLSNVLKTKMDKLEQSIDGQKDKFDMYKQSADLLVESCSIESHQARERIDEYAKTAEHYQAVLLEKLRNLQAQIMNLNAVTEVIKDMSAHAGEARRGEATPNPDRIEEIRDDANGVVVLNHYKKNKLVLSEMYAGNKKIYELEYNSRGKTIRSRNYGSDGDTETELTFYPNGQVKTRTEKMKVNGRVQKVTSNFDERGNKQEDNKK